MPMDWLGFLSAIGFPAIFSGIAILMINRHYQKKDRSEESKEKIISDINLLRTDFESFKNEQEKYHERITNKMDDSNDTLKEDEELTKTLASALLVVIRDRIVQMYDHYSKQEYLPIYARESLDSMYRQYHALGGNGVTEGLIKKLQDLPTDPPKEEEDD